LTRVLSQFKPFEDRADLAPVRGRFELAGRRAGGVTAALVCCVIGGGCGGGGGNVPRLSSTPATKAEATVYAHGVNLGVADMPGMVGVSLEHESKGGPSNDEACRVRESHVHIVDIESPVFRSGKGFQLTEIHSSVEVVSSTALAEHKFDQVAAALRRPATRICLQRRIALEIAQGLQARASRGMKTERGQATALLLHPAVPHSFGLRVVVPITVAGNGVRARLRVYVDSEGFVAGPATIGLTSLSFSQPAPTVPHLLSVLYGRAN
jgi:hypothetical protein